MNQQLQHALRETENNHRHNVERSIIEPLMTRVLDVLEEIPEEMPKEFERLYRALMYLAGTAYPYRRWAEKRGGFSKWIDCPYCRKVAEDETSKQ